MIYLERTIKALCTVQVKNRLKTIQLNWQLHEVKISNHQHTTYPCNICKKRREKVYIQSVDCFFRTLQIFPFLMKCRNVGSLLSFFFSSNTSSLCVARWSGERSGQMNIELCLSVWFKDLALSSIVLTVADNLTVDKITLTGLTFPGLQLPSFPSLLASIAQQLGIWLLC